LTTPARTKTSKRGRARRPGKVPKTAGRPRKDGNNLDLDRIVDAAWKVVDREGAGALTTRKVAAELDVQGPALYWHVKNKQDLMSLMIERALRDSMKSPPADLPWWDWLRAYAREQRRILLMHRDSGQIASSAPPTDHMRTEIMPGVLAPMLRAGVPQAAAAAAIGALAGFVLGTIIYEQSESTRQFALSFNPPEQTFEQGLDCFISGLKQRYAPDTGSTHHRR
jgi:TetR/AcrR family transcriptional regulator, tetracycline repressor protein